MPTILDTPTGWPRLLLSRAGTPDPTDLDAAVRDGAFSGLRRAVRELGPGGVAGVIRSSGLRGRGGGGFPTGEKWAACALVPADRHYVVANGYGADPAVLTDRTLLETDPYAVLEGLALAAFAVGAHEAIVAVRAEATAAMRILEQAVLEAEDAGLLGPDVLGSGFGLSVTIRPVQGAYLLGEETVLLKALEGKRGQPEQRPPYPAERGLFGRPTVVQNVQTLAAAAWIVANGAGRFAATGATTSPGTTLVQLSGSLQAPGIAEVPLGTPLRELLAMAGGVPKGHRLKALLVGGPSGGLLPPDLLDTPYEYDALRAVGAHVGSGSILAADERACVVDLSKVLTRFCADEACGKTIPCRIGTRRLAEIGERLTDGRSRPSDLQLLDDLGHDVIESALCDHERLTTLPLASAVRYFRPEVDDHLLRSTCPAGVCHPIVVAAAAPAHRGVPLL
ncbi:MAG: complex I 51 kDa subunit family protein [Candidatus Limnocylindrales bacterium]